jgi:hypothetical protein
MNGSPAAWCASSQATGLAVDPPSQTSFASCDRGQDRALVRDGLTNREIGTRLFISPRTVQTHVSHILQKTGLRSRVEIARFAGA